MKIESILKEIKKHDWWVEETPANHQACEWAWHGFIESSKYFDKRYLTLGLFFYDDGFVSEVTSRNEKIEQFMFTLRKYKKDKKYIAKKREIWDRNASKLVKLIWDTVAKMEELSGNDFAEVYKKITDLYVDNARYSIFMEAIDPFTEQEVPKILEKELPKISASERSRIAAALSAPAKLSFMEEERIYFLQNVLEVIRDKNNLRQCAQNLEKKYMWMATNYSGSRVKTAVIFQKEIKAIIRKKTKTEINKELGQLIDKENKLREEKKQIIKKYKIKKDIQIIFSLISEMGDWVDKRKVSVLQATFFIYRSLEKFGKMLKVPAGLLGYATYQETYNWATKGKKIPKELLKRRRKYSLWYVERVAPGKSKQTFIFGKEAKNIYENIFSAEKVKEFSGTVASAAKNIVEGEVSVVLNTSTDKFKEGNILVTTMTRPDFLPLMRKAKAIITDEGGLTCHAAIISRELKIPCIIGTRIATRNLKSGDFVQMDTQKGIIKIIKNR